MYKIMPNGDFIKLQSILFLLLRSKKNYLCQAPFVHGIAEGDNVNDSWLLRVNGVAFELIKIKLVHLIIAR